MLILKCTCGCHKMPNVEHCVPCCDNGLIYFPNITHIDLYNAGFEWDYKYEYANGLSKDGIYLTDIDGEFWLEDDAMNNQLIKLLNIQE